MSFFTCKNCTTRVNPIYAADTWGHEELAARSDAGGQVAAGSFYISNFQYSASNLPPKAGPHNPLLDVYIYPQSNIKAKLDIVPFWVRGYCVRLGGKSKS